MNYRMNAKVLSPKGKELGLVSYTVKAKNKVGAGAKVRTLMKALQVRKNVEMVFYDSTGFHPIRASRDYESARVRHGSEGREARSKRAKRSGALYSAHYRK